MPEGPEIHRAAARVHRALAGRQTVEVSFAFDHLERQYGTRLTGLRVEEVSARGKALLTTFEDGHVIYSHNQLYGVWKLVKPYAWPKTSRQLRLALHNTYRSALLYSASEIEVWDVDTIDDHPYIAKLGPDPLRSDVDLDLILERYRNTEFARRSFSTLLFDQGFVAGVGNYLRSEILHMAKVAPDERPSDLDEERTRAIAEATVESMRRAFKSGGVTRHPDEVAELKAQGLTRRHWRHYVFSRATRPCPRCGARIEKESWGGRRLYRCPECQPLRK